MKTRPTETIDDILREMRDSADPLLGSNSLFINWATRIAKARAAELDELRRLAESWDAMGDDLMNICAADIKAFIDKAQEREAAGETE